MYIIKVIIILKITIIRYTANNVIMIPIINLIILNKDSFKMHTPLWNEKITSADLKLSR